MSTTARGSRGRIGRRRMPMRLNEPALIDGDGNEFTLGDLVDLTFDSSLPVEQQDHYWRAYLAQQTLHLGKVFLSWVRHVPRRLALLAGLARLARRVSDRLLRRALLSPPSVEPPALVSQLVDVLDAGGPAPPAGPVVAMLNAA